MVHKDPELKPQAPEGSPPYHWHAKSRYRGLSFPSRAVCPVSCDEGQLILEGLYFVGFTVSGLGFSAFRLWVMGLYP